MAYCLDADVRIHAPQAVPGFDLSGYITQADGVIDAHLQTIFPVPLSPVPQLIENCSSMLAAGKYLKAHYSKINQQAPQFADDLCESAMQILTDIKGNPGLIDVTPKIPDQDDYDRNQITTDDETDPVFNSDNELLWGTDG